MPKSCLLFILLVEALKLDNGLSSHMQTDWIIVSISLRNAAPNTREVFFEDFQGYDHWRSE